MDFVAKAVGFNITPDVLTTNDNNTEKPLLNVFLQRPSDVHKIFSMDVYGLSFADPKIDGQWVQVRSDT